MYIGEIARRTGASPKAIRHYETLGLLGAVGRSGSYRVYAEADVARVELIRQAQALGMRLAELQPLLAGAEPDWSALCRLIEAKRAAVAAEIARLHNLDLRLDAVHREIAACLGADPGAAAHCAHAGRAAAGVARPADAEA
ncbi:MerR family transcriptional regulator [Azoarcus olearius]|uniref:Probable MerR-family transcriptional regulator n=1 Tax=Azoarcus sp. (strain BH72) TaxID=418699 RepID=A1K5J0_AZOSB|nr:MerR family transcriptional regulator [Azoarcus olearius]CAL94095.1 probable MerR-family transcriptional regulator [Azoarcus olearius]